MRLTTLAILTIVAWLLLINGIVSSGQVPREMWISGVNWDLVRACLGYEFVELTKVTARLATPVVFFPFALASTAALCATMLQQMRSRRSH